MNQPSNKQGIAIDVNAAGFGTVCVDGEPVKRVLGASVDITPNKGVTVALRLGTPDGIHLDCEGGAITIADLSMPMRVELALWRYLREKYGREIDVTNLESTAREWTLRDA